MATIFINIHNNLGENILYNELDDSLYWIDINEKQLYTYNLETKGLVNYVFEYKPCSYCFTTDNNILLISFENGFYYFNKNNKELIEIASTYKQIEMCRLNDGKADPYGNFICGGFSENHPDKIPQELWLVSNTKVSNIHNSPKHTIWNATCFSTNIECIYCTDSPKKELWCYDYNIDSLSMSNKRVLYSIIDKDMVFDGACVDRDDYIWTAMYNGSCVYRISPKGVLDTIVNVPTDKYVTSVCIGGKNMDTLFIVTGHFGEMNNMDINGFIYSYKLDKPLGIVERRYINLLQK